MTRMTLIAGNVQTFLSKIVGVLSEDIFFNFENIEHNLSGRSVHYSYSTQQYRILKLISTPWPFSNCLLSSNCNKQNNYSDNWEVGHPVTLIPIDGYKYFRLLGFFHFIICKSKILINVKCLYI